MVDERARVELEISGRGKRHAFGLVDKLQDTTRIVFFGVESFLLKVVFLAFLGSKVLDL